MGESLTCTCLLSIHGTLGEYDVNIKTHQEHLEENLEHVGIFMIACHSHKLTLFCKEYMYVEEKSFGLFFFFSKKKSTPTTKIHINKYNLFSIQNNLVNAQNKI